jgi:cyclic beta-1,2-glucan synthetase
VISGAGEPSRVAQALNSVDEHLVRREEQLVMLFTPPFDRTPLDPGYIKGYVPGVRENGGQYTHAALWTALAHALHGDGDRAMELFQLINPINHALTPSDVERYKVEPYVVAADVYAVSPHTGRGGWTWYTGSAGWMYKIGVEAILGLKLHGTFFSVEPCIPMAWPGYEITFRHRAAVYRITVENPHGVSCGVTLIELDGKRLEHNRIPLDGNEAAHSVRILMGENRATAEL